MLGGINHKHIGHHHVLTGTHSVLPTTYPIPMNPEEKAQSSSNRILTRGRCSKQRTSHADMSSPPWTSDSKVRPETKDTLNLYSKIFFLQNIWSAT
jgi:hypothetical protein